MKSTFILAAILAATSGSRVFAAPSTPSAATARPGVTQPVPVKVVPPTDLPRSFENARVEVTFTLDQQGVPRDVRAVHFLPRQVADKLLPAIAQWRFTPAYDGDRPVRVQVVLPLRLVAGEVNLVARQPAAGAVRQVAE